MKRFLWSGAEDKKRVHLVSWEKVCKPKWVVGLNVKRLGLFNVALLAKTGWRLTKEVSLIQGSILARKYLRDKHFLLEEDPYLEGSLIWRSICSTCFILRDGMRWKLGDKESIRFQEDKWCRPSKLEDLPNIRVMKRVCENSFGTLDKHYQTGQDKDKRWRSFEDLQGLEEEIQRVKGVLDNQYIPKRSYPDFLVWPLSSKGSYMVKDGYNLLMSREGWVKNDLLARVWKLGILPKIAAFWWLCLQNKILTMDNLMKQGVQLVNMCVLCKEEAETLDHRCIHCPYSNGIWNEIWYRLGLVQVSSKTLRDQWITWDSPFKSKTLASIWKMIPPVDFQNIWKERNRRNFEGKETNRVILVTKIRKDISEILVPRKEDRIPKGEEGILEDWGVSLLKQGSEGRKAIKWIPPDITQAKINFDGAAKGNPREAGGGGLYRDHMGNLNWAYAEDLYIQTI